MFLIIINGNGWAEQSQPVAAPPSAQEILKTLTDHVPLRQHPRLLASAADFERARRLIATDPFAKAVFAKVRAQADQTLKEAPVRYELPDGVRLLSIIRKTLSRVLNLAFTYQMTKDSRYGERAWQELATISDASCFADWHPVHYLDVAELTAAAAIGFDWLYDYLHADQRKRIADAIDRNAFDTVLPLYRDRKGWTQARHNWNAVCNGGVGLGALALADERADLTRKAGAVLEGGLRSLPMMLREFGPDGGWGEGVGYWDYANRYLAYYLASLDICLGTDYGLTAYPGFAKTGYFPIAMTGSNGIFNFADAGKGRVIRTPTFFWLANKFAQPDFAAYARKFPSNTPLDILWYRPTPLQSGTIKSDHYFRGVEAVGLHSAIAESNDLFVGFKAGANQYNHCDLDIGTFVIDAFGKRWADDLGPDNYNLPGYFSSKANGQRWTYYRKRAESHNTLLINPGSGPDQEVGAHAKIVEFDSNEDRAYAIADLTPAYRRQALSVRRGVALFKRSSQIMIEDEITLGKPGEVWWLMHTAARIELAPSGSEAVLIQGDDRMSVKVLAPVNARLRVLPATPLPTSPNPPGQLHQQPNNFQTLALHCSDELQTTIAVVISPLPVPDLTAKILPLNSWITKLQ